MPGVRTFSAMEIDVSFVAGAAFRNVFPNVVAVRSGSCWQGAGLGTPVRLRSPRWWDMEELASVRGLEWRGQFRLGLHAPGGGDNPDDLPPYLEVLALDGAMLRSLRVLRHLHVRILLVRDSEWSAECDYRRLDDAGVEAELVYLQQHGLPSLQALVVAISWHTGRLVVRRAGAGLAGLGPVVPANHGWWDLVRMAVL